MAELDHVRLMYAVPALRGVRVTYEDCKGVSHEGVITGEGGSGIRVRLDGDKRGDCYHPTGNITYHPTPEQLATCEARRRAYWAEFYPKHPYQSRGWVEMMETVFGNGEVR